MSLTPTRYTHTEMFGPKTLAAREHNDCAVKALAVATGYSYDDCHAFWALHGRKPGRGTFTYRTLDRGTKEFPELGFKSTIISGIRARHWDSRTASYVACRTAPDGLVASGTTLRSFCRTHPKGRFLVTVAHHALAIVDGVVYDYCARDLRRIRDVWAIERI